MEVRLIQFFGTKLSDAYTCAKANFTSLLVGKIIESRLVIYLKIIVKIDT
jgi:hypothetical protein